MLDVVAHPGPFAQAPRSLSPTPRACFPTARCLTGRARRSLCSSPPTRVGLAAAPACPNPVLVCAAQKRLPACVATGCCARPPGSQIPAAWPTRRACAVPAPSRRSVTPISRTQCLLCAGTAGQVIEGLDLAVTKMKEGERALVTVAPQYAWGQQVGRWRDSAGCPA